MNVPSLRWRADWGLAATAMLALFVSLPLLSRGIPDGSDSHLHLFRAIEFDSVLRSGVWMPRWARS